MASTSREVALRVEGAYKSYSSQSKVLNNLNMTIRAGTIYGLLGPSGCGKTTLLRSIVGIIPLDRGQIYIKMRQLQKIGYMPQELSLFPELSITETFLFYGRVFGMHVSEIKRRSEELVSLLHLPEGHRMIPSLSGGEQRRMSLAVALLHNPEFLILDEPTVGVDPELRHSLWVHFFSLVEEGKTILITTHYTEEARQANAVGLMRGGKLVAEDSPQAILDSQCCSTLEEAFLRFCTSKQGWQNTKSTATADITPSKNPQSHLDPEPLFTYGKFSAVLKRNILWAKRSIGVVILIMLLPGVMSFVGNEALIPPYNLQLGIISEEASCSSTWLHNCPNNSESISCIYKEYLPKDRVIVKEYPSIQRGKEGIRSGDIWGMIYFRENFSSATLMRLNLGRRATNKVIDDSSIDIWLDMSDQTIGHELKLIFIQTYLNFSVDVMESCSFENPKSVQPPIRIEAPIFGKRSPVFAHTALPALNVMFAFFHAFQFSMAAVIAEKTSGQLERNFAAGISFLYHVLAILLFNCVIMIVRTLIIILVNYNVYDNPLRGSVIYIACIIVLAEFFGLICGFLVAFIFKDQKGSTLTGLGSLTVLNTLSGCLWPQEGLPEFLKKLVLVLPLLPVIKSYEGIAHRGWTMSHPVVYYGFIHSVICLLLFSVLTFFVYRAKKVGNS